MEAVSPITLVYMLWKFQHVRDYQVQMNDMSLSNTSIPFASSSAFLTLLFVLHYINRAVVAPFLRAPSMSPIHLFVVIMAVLFNFVNASCLAGWLVGYDIVPVVYTRGFGYDSANRGRHSSGLLQCIGILLFFVGLFGNIYSEKCLFGLRVQEGDKRAAAAAAKKGTQNNEQNHENEHKDKSENKYHKVYVIPPPHGPFRSILYPHYVFEWLEWLGFSLLGTAIIPSSRGAAGGENLTIHLSLVPWLIPFAILAGKLNLPLPLPPLLFLVNAVANMLPHARWGRKWYVDRFGERAVAGRGAVVPWCKWL